MAGVCPGHPLSGGRPQAAPVRVEKTRNEIYEADFLGFS